MIILASIVLLFLYLPGIIYRRFSSPGPCLYGRDWGEPREAYAPGYHWEVVQNEVTGDVDVLPLREEHVRGAACSCNPRVDVEGACLVIVHNAFDNREIVEEAVRVMNGESE